MWALGVILYQLMAGTVPYEETNKEIRKSDIINNNRKDLPNHFSLELRGIVDLLLEPV